MSFAKPKTRAEMRELDRRAADEYATPSLLLMENAGRGAADVASRMTRPEDGVVMVFCGRGSNGGDGFVLARHLHNRGYAVRCYYVGGRIEDVDRRSDAGVNLEIVRRMRIPILEHEHPGDPDAMARAVAGTALFVDAHLGTGLEGPAPVREPYLSVIRFLDARRAPILAIDIPSGLDCDTGVALGAAVKARRTATCAAPKVGFALADGPAHAGEVEVVDIGLPRELLHGA